MARHRRETATAAKAGRSGGNKNTNGDDSANDDANEDGAPKPPKVANPYVYRRVPFGFPPWYLDDGVESSADLWARLADRHRSMSARVSNMSLAIDKMRRLKRPVRHGDVEDRNFLSAKMAGVADALKAFSELRKGPLVAVTDKPLQVLNYAEDCLWMALGRLCTMLEVKLPEISYGADEDWEERLNKLMEKVAV